MAKIYSTDVPEPKYDYSKLETLQKTDDDYIEAVRAEIKAKGYTGEFTGEVIQFPHQENMAYYMVLSLRPLSLIHLPIGDAIVLPEAWERGLTVKDVRAIVERNRTCERVFGRKG